MRQGLLLAGLSCALAVCAAPARAEQCVDGVHAVAGWTASIVGNAVQWIGSARARGFRVDHSPANGAVVVYPPNYGRGISPTFGHVALVVDANTDRSGRITIIDSHGICGGNRRQCKARQPNWLRVWVIHPK
jgi:surface antigen